MSICQEKSLLKVTANQGKLFREQECIASNVISKLKTMQNNSTLWSEQLHTDVWCNENFVLSNFWFLLVCQICLKMIQVKFYTILDIVCLHTNLLPIQIRLSFFKTHQNNKELKMTASSFHTWSSQINLITVKWIRTYIICLFFDFFKEITCTGISAGFWHWSLMDMHDFCN